MYIGKAEALMMNWRMNQKAKCWGSPNSSTGMKEGTHFQISLSCSDVWYRRLGASNTSQKQAARGVKPPVPARLQTEASPAPPTSERPGEAGPRPAASPAVGTAGSREWKMPAAARAGEGKGRKAAPPAASPEEARGRRATGSPPRTDGRFCSPRRPAQTRQLRPLRAGWEVLSVGRPRSRPPAGGGRRPVPPGRPAAGPAYLFSAWGSSRAGERRLSPQSAECCCARAL